MGLLAISCNKTAFFMVFRYILWWTVGTGIAIPFIKTSVRRGFVTEYDMETITRSLSTQERKVVLALTERGQREATRAEIVDLLGGRVKAADHVIQFLRRKGWLERATWGEYLLIPPEQGA